jgi:predicted PurR-regulated permease PerM
MAAQAFVTIMLLAIFLSLIGVHPVYLLDKKKIPHWLSVTLVLTGYLLIISGLSSIVGSSVSSFTSHLSKYEDHLSVTLNSLSESLKPYGLELSPQKLTQLFNPAKVFSFTALALGQLGNVMSNMALVFFIVMFILLEMNDIALKAKVIGSTSSKKKNLTSLSEIEKSLRHYLFIKTLTSLATGFLITFSLWIIGVEYPFLWGLIAFLLNYIPNIGSIIAAIPAMLFTWIQLGFVPAVWTTVIYVIVNTLIGYFVEPKVMGKGMGLSSLVVFLSLIIWGYVLGIVGMFLSVPLTMAIKIILENSESTKPLAAMLGTREDALNLFQKNLKKQKDR